MNKPNALNPGASSTTQAIAEEYRVKDASPGIPADEQAYGNSRPGTVGNVPGAHKAAESDGLGTTASRQKAGAVTTVELHGKAS